MAAEGFDPSRLIDDSHFIAINNLTIAEIQGFLSDQCGFLATYSENGRSAAQIIYDASHGFGDASGDWAGITINSSTGTVNPAVLLVTLQKEQSLITRTEAGQNVLDTAMGYGCPDSGGCNPAYQGFTKQVENAAWQLRYNYERAQGHGFDDYQVGQSFAFNDYNGLHEGVFGNRATAALYRYTPHVYNGNYNFWNLFNQWFGLISVSTHNLNVDTHGGILGTETHVDLTLKYNGQLTNDLSIAIVARRQDSHGYYSQNYDFGNIGPYAVPKGATLHLHERRFLPTGNYKIYGAYYFFGSWIPMTDEIAYVSVHKAKVSTEFSVKSHYDNRQNVSVPVKFTNNEGRTLYVSGFGLAARSGGENVDFPSAPGQILTPGQSVTINFSKTFADRDIQVYPIIKLDSVDWYRVGTVKKIGIWPDQVYRLNFSGFSVDQDPPYYNDPINVRFNITNPTSEPIVIPQLRLAGRRFSQPNYDFGLAPNIVVPAESTIPIHFSTVLGKSGQFEFWPIYSNASGNDWVSLKPGTGESALFNVLVK